MKWVMTLVFVAMLAGCQHSVKNVDPIPYEPMNEDRATEIAVAAAKARGWEGPFETLLRRSISSGQPAWATVIICDRSRPHRLAIVHIRKSGHVSEFDENEK
jgi:hypothetical protein